MAVHLAIVRGPDEAAAPQTRGDCAGVPRPCPFTECRYHLLPEFARTKRGLPGARGNPAMTLGEMTESCALDVADRGGTTLDEVGRLLGLTRERIRQIEVRGLERMKATAPRVGLSLMPERQG